MLNRDTNMICPISKGNWNDASVAISVLRGATTNNMENETRGAVIETSAITPTNSSKVTVVAGRRTIAALKPMADTRARRLRTVTMCGEGDMSNDNLTSSAVRAKGEANYARTLPSPFSRKSLS